MIDMFRPLFSCAEEYCREAQSLPAEMLRLWAGDIICEDCFAEEQPTLDWHELSEFVPNEDRTINNLTVLVKAQVEAIRRFEEESGILKTEIERLNSNLVIARWAVYRLEGERKTDKAFIKNLKEKLKDVVDEN